MTRRWLERLASPVWWPIPRKRLKFVSVPRGPHKIKSSLPLAVIVRDVLKLAEGAVEARHIIKAGKVLVDCRKIRDPRFSVGPMDIIEVQDVGSWRAVPGRRLHFVATTGRDARLKLCKIIGKTVVKGGKCQINMHDGRSILTEEKYATGDSLLLELPGQRVISRIALEPGALVLVVAGKLVGKLGRLRSIERVPPRVWLEIERKVIEVPLKAAFVVGVEKPAVRLD
jgi:small subunit ribosomal protein S4e